MKTALFCIIVVLGSATATHALCSDAQLDRITARATLLQSQLKIARNNVRMLTKKMVDLDAENSDLKDKIAELEAAQCDDLQKQVDDLTSQLSDAKDELTTAQDDLATCTDAKDQICTAVNNGDDTSELCPVDPTNKMAKPATAGR